MAWEELDFDDGSCEPDLGELLEEAWARYRATVMVTVFTLTLAGAGLFFAVIGAEGFQLAKTATGPILCVAQPGASRFSEYHRQLVCASARYGVSHGATH